MSDEDKAQEELTAQSPAIVHSKRRQWLMRRRELITASDVAAILGVDPFRRPSDVYMEKIGESVTEETEAMRWGKRLEDAIADGYKAETKRRVHAEPAYEVVTHPQLPWLGATLDRGVTCDGYNPFDLVVPGPLGPHELGALELKATADPSKWEEEPPVAYQVQLTVQMAVTGRSWGSLAAFVSLLRPVVWFDRAHDPELFGLMVPKLEEFRAYVLRREPPTDDPEWFSRAAIKKLWPTDTGEEIHLDAAARDLVTTWETAKEQASAAEEAQKAAEDALRVRLGAAAVGDLLDGTFLTLLTTHVKAEEKPRPAHSYRTLRHTRARPKVSR